MKKMLRLTCIDQTFQNMSKQVILKKQLNMSNRIEKELQEHYIKKNLRQSCHHTETSQPICVANQLIGFYMITTLAINPLQLGVAFLKATPGCNGLMS